MKHLVVLAGLLFASSSLAGHCKTGDLNACAGVLTQLHKAKVPPAKFVRTFDEICSENAKFRCVKRIVRGDVKEEMKLTKEENPKAHLYEVRQQAENYIFIFETK